MSEVWEIAVMCPAGALLDALSDPARIIAIQDPKLQVDVAGQSLSLLALSPSTPLPVHHPQWRSGVRVSMPSEPPRVFQPHPEAHHRISATFLARHAIGQQRHDGHSNPQREGPQHIHCKTPTYNMRLQHSRDLFRPPQHPATTTLTPQSQDKSESRRSRPQLPP